MNGKELAKAIKAAKGKIAVEITTPKGGAFVYAEKADLARWAAGWGDTETSMKLQPEGERAHALVVED